MGAEDIFPYALLAVGILSATSSRTYRIPLNYGSGRYAELSMAENGKAMDLLVRKGEEIQLRGSLGRGLDYSNFKCEGATCSIGDVNLTFDSDGSRIQVSFDTPNLNLIISDCFDLEVGTLNWFGGPQMYQQEWPIEKAQINQAYVLNKTSNFAVAERYWLNSRGTYIYLDERVPLFVDQNVGEAGQVCFSAKAKDPYINRERIIFNYTVGTFDNPKDAHLDAVNTFLGKPTGYPDARMISEPTWTTWPKFKQNVDDDKVRSFANDILSHGFKGQLEIDEDWQTCFGTLEFKSDKFANIKETVEQLKENFRVTLWVCPFVNSDCSEVCSIGEEKGYFVKNTTGSLQSIWWESDDARQIDFTNPEAAKWFSDRVEVLLTNPGVESFKFDAGETNYGPQPSVYENVDQELVPNILSESYIRTVAKFGNLIEVRSAYRTQDLPIFIRMIDKDSVWGIDDGLESLVTTLLQMNMNGYGLVLPDMIGGNSYRQGPTIELIVRWTQATALMPAMQFGFLPWDYPTDEYNATEIVHNMVDLHESYAPVIIKAMEESMSKGTPVNPPIWWVDPEDTIAHAIYDEFLLGESVLVAPVLKEGATSRNVYLPKGTWLDGNNGSVYEGPTNLNYLAPIEVLPYFIKTN